MNFSGAKTVLSAGKNSLAEVYWMPLKYPDIQGLALSKIKMCLTKVVYVLTAQRKQPELGTTGQPTEFCFASLQWSVVTT